MTFEHLSLDPKEVRARYPRSCDKALSWIHEKLLRSAGDVPGYKEQVEQLVKSEYVDTILQYTPRVLYDFFDDQQTRISIECGDMAFRFSLNGHNNDDGYDQPVYGNRWDTEKAAFFAAFEYLEHVIQTKGD